jgi:tetratricopeptide (TPR) repeat protein
MRLTSGSRGWLLLVVVAAVSVYLITIGHGFAFDDGIAIEKNLDIRSLGNLGQIFSHSEWESGGLENHLYRPLTTATYALNYALTGLSPWSYHLVNVLLHGVLSGLILLLGLRWKLPVEAAGAAALLFAVHPIHVEAVANVVGRKEILAALFVVLMVLVHPKAVRRGGLALLGPPLVYVAAMLSKEVGAVGMGLVIAQDVLLPDQRPAVGRPRLRSAALYGIYVVAFVAFLAVHRAVAGSLPLESIAFIDNPAANSGALARWLTGVAVLGKGIALHFVPLNLSPDYSFNAIPTVAGVTDPRFLGALGAIVAWFWLGLRLRRRAPAVLFGAVWYGIAILPASNLLFPVGTIFGERLLYLPGVGLFLAIGWCLQEWLGRRSRRLFRIAVGTLTMVLAALGVRYAAMWGDELELFRLATRHQPASTKVHYKLAELSLKAGRLDEALLEARIAYRITPRNVRSGILIAEVQTRQGALDAAESILSEVLRHEPDSPDALYGMGAVWRDRANYESAEHYWLRALTVDPNHGPSLVDLGTLALVRADTARAVALLQRGVASDPGKASGWYNLGLIYERRGDTERSREAYDRFIEVAGPEYAEAVRALRTRR